VFSQNNLHQYSVELNSPVYLLFLISVISQIVTCYIMFITVYIIYHLYSSSRSWGNSGSTVSDYILDDRGLIPGRGTGFWSGICVQTSSEAQPTSYPMGTSVPFAGGKARSGRDADHSPHLVPTSGMSTRYSSSPPLYLHCVAGQFYLTCVFNKIHKQPETVRGLLTSELSHEQQCAARNRRTVMLM
jgi:hypothetical protein